MTPIQGISLCLLVLFKLSQADFYPQKYSPPATSYGVPIQAVEGPKNIVSSFGYDIPKEIITFHDVPAPPKPISQVYGVPHAAYDVPDIPKPIPQVYGVPEVVKPKPKPIEIVYDVPEVPKPILPVYGVPEVVKPQPKPVEIVYDVPIIEEPKPTISQVYGVPVTEAIKPKPIKVVYDFVVEEPKPVYGLPTPVRDVPVVHDAYGVPNEVREIPRLYAPYP